MDYAVCSVAQVCFSGRLETCMVHVSRNVPGEQHLNALILDAQSLAQGSSALREGRQQGIREPLRQPLQPLEGRLQPVAEKVCLYIGQSMCSTLGDSAIASR